MASLVEQIFVQSQSGSAGGQGFGDFYAKGKQLGQEQQRINLAERQLGAELAMLPLKQTLMQQESRQRELEITSMLTQRDMFLRGQEAMTNLSKDVSMALSEAEPIDALKIHAREGLKNPILLTNPGYQQIGKQLEAIMQESSNAEARLMAAEARMKAAEAAELRAQSMGASVDPQIKVVEGEKFLVNPRTGALHRVDRTMSRSQFIAENVTKWINEGLASNENDAASKLGAFYDQNIRPPTPTSAPESQPSQGSKRFKWTPNGMVPQ